MTAKLTWRRITAAAVVTVAAYSVLAASGLWGVALGAVALVWAPSAVRDVIVETKAKRQFRAELASIPGWKRRG
jgi:hypothetical protein